MAAESGPRLTPRRSGAYRGLMKGPLERPAATEAEAVIIEGVALALVRRRNESRLLALAGAVFAIFVAIAVAKPWGAGSPIARANPTGGQSTGRQSSGGQPTSHVYTYDPADMASPYIAAGPDSGSNSVTEFVWYCLPSDDAARSDDPQAVPYETTQAIRIGSNGTEQLIVPAGATVIGVGSCDAIQIDQMVRQLESAHPSSR